MQPDVTKAKTDITSLQGGLGDTNNKLKTVSCCLSLRQLRRTLIVLLGCRLKTTSQPRSRTCRRPRPRSPTPTLTSLPRNRHSHRQAEPQMFSVSELMS